MFGTPSDSVHQRQQFLELQYSNCESPGQSHFLIIPNRRGGVVVNIASFGQDPPVASIAAWQVRGGMIADIRLPFRRGPFMT